MGGSVFFALSPVLCRKICKKGGKTVFAVFFRSYLCVTINYKM